MANRVGSCYLLCLGLAYAVGVEIVYPADCCVYGWSGGWDGCWVGLYGLSCVAEVLGSAGWLVVGKR